MPKTEIHRPTPPKSTKIVPEYERVLRAKWAQVPGLLGRIIRGKKPF